MGKVTVTYRKTAGGNPIRFTDEKGEMYFLMETEELGVQDAIGEKDCLRTTTRVLNREDAEDMARTHHDIVRRVMRHLGRW